jgi:hypothetical protein
MVGDRHTHYALSVAGQPLCKGTDRPCIGLKDVCRLNLEKIWQERQPELAKVKGPQVTWQAM